MLKFEKLELDSAFLGQPVKTADIQKPSEVPYFSCDDSVGAGEGDNFGKGMVASIIPYRMQSSYDRNFEYRKYDAAILENEYLRAEFLPSLGGRLLSLYDKKLKRDIVYRNDSLIFANLALRNAWFAGGVEWNIGVRGHTYFTCDKMFAAKVIGKKGHEILRMYEYEEIRGLVYCIEATLEKDKLLVHITVKNTREEPTYMYWWSNMAIEETENTRVFVPADKSYVTSYREGGYKISKIDVPGKYDISKAANAKIAIDYFYDIPEKNKKWISGLEADGKGVLQYSDAVLKGRKTFMWGKQPGGLHWNRWLTNKNECSDALSDIGTCRKNRNYLEIQAGLCKTQFEHFLVDGGTELSWNEVYTGIDIGTNVGDYGEICAKIDAFVPQKLDFGDIFMEASKEPPVYFGSGKGYLAERLYGRELFNKCEFPYESVGADERYYLGILDGKRIAGDENTAFVYDKNWISALGAVENKNFFDFYISGICAYANLDYDKALEYLNESVKLERTYYNLAALGLMYLNVYERQEKGFEYLLAAFELNPEYIPLAIQLGEAAIKCGKYAEFVGIYAGCAQEIKNSGRMKMYVGQCLVQLGETEQAKEYINASLVVEDVREGEYAISNIWIMLYKKELAKITDVPESDISDDEVLEKYPIPYSIDFRMH